MQYNFLSLLDVPKLVSSSGEIKINFLIDFHNKYYV